MSNIALQPDVAIAGSYLEVPHLHAAAGKEGGLTKDLLPGLGIQ